MEPLSIFFTLHTTLTLFFLLSHHHHLTQATSPPPSPPPPPSSCKKTCGSIQLNYPFGSGYGCGSPQFNRYISCTSAGDQDQLLLNTHTGTYPITSISYTTTTLTITPPHMSTCNSMQSAPNFGLDYPSPFQLGPSFFILLSCPSPTSSLTIKGTPICDTSNSHLCASIHTCPAVVSLGLSIFAPTDTCCVYLNAQGDLDLQKLKCAGYVSVLSMGDVPTDPNRWEYGISLKYNQVGLDNNIFATRCEACERSDGTCGYAPPRNNFLCVCKSGVNSSADCYNQVPAPFWSSDSFRVFGSIDYRVLCLCIFVLLVL